MATCSLFSSRRTGAGGEGVAGGRWEWVSSGGVLPVWRRKSASSHTTKLAKGSKGQRPSVQISVPLNCGRGVGDREIVSLPPVPKFFPQKQRGVVFLWNPLGVELVPRPWSSSTTSLTLCLFSHLVSCQCQILRDQSIPAIAALFRHAAKLQMLMDKMVGMWIVG
jgi:hypothetical protein